MLHSGQIIATLAIVAATTFCGHYLYFDSYQPDVPECLRESWIIPCVANVSLQLDHCKWSNLELRVGSNIALRIRNRFHQIEIVLASHEVGKCRKTVFSDSCGAFFMKIYVLRDDKVLSQRLLWKRTSYFVAWGNIESLNIHDLEFDCRFFRKCPEVYRCHSPPPFITR